MVRSDFACGHMCRLYACCVQHAPGSVVVRRGGSECSFSDGACDRSVVVCTPTNFAILRRMVRSDFACGHMCRLYACCVQHAPGSVVVRRGGSECSFSDGACDRSVVVCTPTNFAILRRMVRSDFACGHRCILFLCYVVYFPYTL